MSSSKLPLAGPCHPRPRGVRRIGPATRTCRPTWVQPIAPRTLDSIACCLYGATFAMDPQSGQMVEDERAALRRRRHGHGRRTPVANAVLVNATAGHAFEL